MVRPEDGEGGTMYLQTGEMLQSVMVSGCSWRSFYLIYACFNQRHSRSKNLREA